ncbi:STAS domain-containing protein [Quatrionicoccus australiensis]|uniref:STAS domain-containing protein n=1 Tax=Quatrionicoccus australiensis TaxID=138118 RepID=UPI001CF8DCF7|nr:STAS domain-containing protein [Quatrionicoccus australiensis]UCV14531.1 anti-sigma factor antagonist [Quatrionicoccus australiensis]
MQIDSRGVGERTPVLSLSGRLDFTRRQEFLAAVDGFFNGLSMPVEVQLDCANLTYLDSSGLGLLLVVRDRARNLGCTVALLGCNAGVREILGTVQFGRLFRVS